MFEYDQKLELYHQMSDEINSMPEWARKECLYNCASLYEEKEDKTNNVIRIVRFEIASALRSVADAIYPEKSA